MTNAGYTAVVTGAAGFQASQIVSDLLAKGWNVRGTVRSASDNSKVGHLKVLAEALPGALELYEADLLKEGSFDTVVKGADYVFHTASPYRTGVPADELLKPAIQGTKTVMHSVVKNKATVKRVVLTSSFAAMLKFEKGPSNGKLYNEEDWNDESQPDEQGGYLLSKVTAEKEAWKIAKENGIDLVVINPTGIFGPVLSDRADATSVQQIKGILEGTCILFPFVCDVRDVSKAHIAAAEIPKAKGRYLLTHDHLVPNQEIIDVIKQRFPQYKITATPNDDGKTGRFADISKLQKELGLSLTRWETSVVDMAISLINKGIAHPKPAS